MSNKFVLFRKQETQPAQAMNNYFGRSFGEAVQYFNTHHETLFPGQYVLLNDHGIDKRPHVRFWVEQES